MLVLLVLVLFVTARVRLEPRSAEAREVPLSTVIESTIAADDAHDGAADRTRTPSTSLGSQREPATLETKALSAWFGKHKVLERCTLAHGAAPGDRADRAVGLRQVDVPADPQPDARADPRRALAGEVVLDGDDIYGARARARPQVRTRIGMVFQKPNPFPAMSIPTTCSPA